MPLMPTLLFPYISSFLYDLHLKTLVNVKLDVRTLVKSIITLKVAHFIDLLNFEWYGQNKGGNIVMKNSNVGCIL